MPQFSANEGKLSENNINALAAAVQSNRTVSGLTHAYYRYPARFSPQFARTAIERFTRRGDLVVDPFMGGGTSIVESFALGRASVGIDISSLATFVSQAKTIILANDQVERIGDWADTIIPMLNTRHPSPRPSDWIVQGYQTNISSRTTWPIRKSVELALHALDLLDTLPERTFVRCAILKTAQWALDSKRVTPSAAQFRLQLHVNIRQMIEGMLELRSAISVLPDIDNIRPIQIQASIVDESIARRLNQTAPAQLILTSPPYPGMHVLYHRWQVHGRRETPAPFWIADCSDGNGAAHYTLGDRSKTGQVAYFRQIEQAFKQLASFSDRQTLVIQLVGFSDPERQLPKYLKAMDAAGFKEHNFPSRHADEDGRI